MLQPSIDPMPAEPSAVEPSAALRFAGFSLDATTGELWRDGSEKTLLRPQLAALLELLLRHPGRVVTRAEIQRDLWGEQVLDVDRGINFCVRQLREVLGDDAKEPRFIETLPRQGYRFMMPVEKVTAAAAKREAGTVEPTIAVASVEDAGSGTSPVGRSWVRDLAFFTAGALGMLCAVVLLRSLFSSHSLESGEKTRHRATSVGATGRASPSAADLAFHRGEQQFHQGLAGEAMESFRQAIAHDPAHASAWLELARVHLLIAADDAEHFTQAELALERARELSPDSARVDIRTGDLLAQRTRDWAGALRAYRRAVEREPDNAEAHASLALVLSILGRPKQAVDHTSRALELDALNVQLLHEATRIYAAAGRFEEMRITASRILELKERSTLATAQSIMACLRLGMREEARAAARGLLPQLGESPGALSFSTDEDFDQLWLWFIERLLHHPGHRTRGLRAAFLAELGRRQPHYLEAAFEKLEVMAQSGTWYLPYFLRDPRIAALEGDGRFHALRQRAGLEPR